MKQKTSRMPRAGGKSERKFRELLLYIAERSERDARFGATKLNKILFYSDFWAYRKTGSSITGQEYQKLERGPAPKRLLPVVKKMEKQEVCTWAERDHYGLPQCRLIARREPDLSLFSGEEIAIVDQVIRELWNLNATEVSDLSHQFIGWQIAREGEEIPYSTVRLGTPRPPTPEEIEYGRELVKESES